MAENYYISVTTDIDKFRKNVGNFIYKQMPYAEALMLTALAADVAKAEKDALPKVFDRPTPFTVNSIRIIPARKGQNWSKVFIMDIAAEYLYPYEVHGMHKLIGRGITWLNPKDKSLLNQYGNFPQRTLERLIGTKAFAQRGRPKRGARPLAGKGAFIGEVTLPSGEKVGGVWQRVEKGGKAGRGLKLLIRFGDAHPARQNLQFGERGEKVVALNFQRRFVEALRRAGAI